MPLHQHARSPCLLGQLEQAAADLGSLVDLAAVQVEAGEAAQQRELLGSRPAARRAPAPRW